MTPLPSRSETLVLAAAKSYIDVGAQIPTAIVGAGSGIKSTHVASYLASAAAKGLIVRIGRCIYCWPHSELAAEAKKLVRRTGPSPIYLEHRTVPAPNLASGITLQMVMAGRAR